jgi:hypothetical protein
MRVSGTTPHAHTCSHRFRPRALLGYEHMFSSQRTSTLAQRALGALRMTRSFLLLEDDHDVDWEVDRDERPRVAHPHRAPLRRRCIQRRPGQAAPAANVCLSPIGASAPTPSPRWSPLAPRVQAR